jgi:Phytanoyl-CoA dioxygenase (PhyH)
MDSLTSEQIQRFIEYGFIRLDDAFPRDLADEGREILWKDTGCDRRDRSTWTRAVIWLGAYDQEPFRRAVNMPGLHAAFDQLVGKGCWEPRYSLGTFPVRFPTRQDTGDTGWHVDAGFAGTDSDANDFFTWRINVSSRDRALLMLFLFSDVGEKDAPTRIRVGSHLEVARILEPAGEAGIRFTELNAPAGFSEAIAVGEAGTVYLCHPFLVHAAQINHGTQPRFMAQPPLHPAKPFELRRSDPGSYSPVEIAIRRGLGWQ